MARLFFQYAAIIISKIGSNFGHILNKLSKCLNFAPFGHTAFRVK